MSILSRTKSLLPASSRSLHAMYHELGQMHGQMGQMWAEVGETRIKLNNLIAQVEAFRAAEASSDTRMMMMLWELSRREGESLDEAKRRYLTSLPAATGKARLYQLASAQLLFEFDAFCSEHGLSYWLQSGTLLGAVRHGGFIPWDDDLDVAMPRQDIERIIGLVADDERYRVTVRYDWYVHCRQVRFCFADPLIPCFIDLFYFDPVARVGKDAFVAREAQRAALEADLMADEALEEFWNAGAQFVDEGTDEAALVRRHFDEHVDALYEAGVLTRSIDEAEGLVWAIDNVNSGVRHHSWYITPKEDILPLGRMAFEGHEVNVPINYMSCLEAIFGNIYDLPKTVGSYFDHLLDDTMDDEDTLKALERVARKA